jgi:hypothetical protein
MVYIRGDGLTVLSTANDGLLLNASGTVPHGPRTLNKTGITLLAALNLLNNIKRKGGWVPSIELPGCIHPN